MKALFVGDFNYLTVSFAAKLAKNGVSLAVSNRNRNKPELGFAYTKYNPENSYLGNLYQNFRPDVVIFSAGYDENQEPQLLYEVLSEACENNIKRVIYLSETSVYGMPEGFRLVSEEFPPAPQSKRSLYFAIGEDICRRFSKSSDMLITILRLGAVYGPGIHGAFLNQLVSELIEGRDTSLNENALLAFLHINDAAEAFYQIFDTAFSDVYNISSGRIIEPCDFLKLIDEHEARGSLILDGSTKTESLAADNQRLQREYQWRERHSLHQELSSVFESEKEYARQRDKRLKQQEKKDQSSATLLRSLRGYAETLLLFIPLVLITRLQASVDLLQGVDFTVIYLVIIAIALELNHAAVSLLLSIGLLISQKISLGYDFFSAVINNQTLLTAVEYCVVSLAFSYVLQRRKTKTRLQKLELEEQSRDMRQLEQFSEDNLRTRHFFEDQILSYEMSFPKVIAMASRLDTLEPERIIPDTVSIIGESVGCRDVSVYFIGKHGGRMRLSFAKSEAAARLGQSPLIETILPAISVLEQDEVFVNLQLDENLPSLASGVKIDGRLAFVFTVWNLPFKSMRQDVLNLLKSITALVSAALHRANQYEESIAAVRYLPGSSVIRPQLFKALCENRLLDDGIGGVLCKIENSLGKAAAYSKQLEPLIRESDYLGCDTKENLYILLSGTTNTGYELFANRLLQHGIESTLVDRAALA